MVYPLGSSNTMSLNLVIKLCICLQLGYMPRALFYVGVHAKLDSYLGFPHTLLRGKDKKGKPSDPNEGMVEWWEDLPPWRIQKIIQQDNGNTFLVINKMSKARGKATANERLNGD